MTTYYDEEYGSAATDQEKEDASRFGPFASVLGPISRRYREEEENRRQAYIRGATGGAYGNQPGKWTRKGVITGLAPQQQDERPARQSYSPSALTSAARAMQASMEADSLPEDFANLQRMNADYLNRQPEPESPASEQATYRAPSAGLAPLRSGYDTAMENYRNAFDAWRSGVNAGLPAYQLRGLKARAMLEAGAARDAGELLRTTIPQEYMLAGNAQRGALDTARQEANLAQTLRNQQALGVGEQNRASAEANLAHARLYGDQAADSAFWNNIARLASQGDTDAQEMLRRKSGRPTAREAAIQEWLKSGGVDPKMLETINRIYPVEAAPAPARGPEHAGIDQGKWDTAWKNSGGDQAKFNKWVQGMQQRRANGGAVSAYAVGGAVGGVPVEYAPSYGEPPSLDAGSMQRAHALMSAVEKGGGAMSLAQALKYVSLADAPLGGDPMGRQTLPQGNAFGYAEGGMVDQAPFMGWGSAVGDAYRTAGTPDYRPGTLDWRNNIGAFGNTASTYSPGAFAFASGGEVPPDLRGFDPNKAAKVMEQRAIPPEQKIARAMAKPDVAARVASVGSNAAPVARSAILGTAARAAMPLYTAKVAYDTHNTPTEQMAPVAGFQAGDSLIGDMAIRGADFGRRFATGLLPGYASGGGVRPASAMSAALGGADVDGRRLLGPGTPTSDSIPAVIDGSRPAALSTGEFVVSHKGASRYNDKQLQAVNKGIADITVRSAAKRKKGKQKRGK